MKASAILEQFSIKNPDYQLFNNRDFFCEIKFFNF